MAGSAELKHGIVLLNGLVDGDAERLVEYGVAAEEAGWDGVFLADHLVPGSERPWPDPWITHAAIAARTDEVVLGSWVTPVARRQPWQVARDLATLDRLSDGRVLLGAGLGRAFDYTTFGEPWEPRRIAARYDEALEIIDGLWSGEPFSYDGDHYSVDDAVLQPTPVQTPRIPVVVGGIWPNKRPFHRGARWDGIVPHYRGDGVIPAEGVDAQDTGDLDLPERPGGPEDEVREMVEYYLDRTDEPGEILLPADPPHGDDNWLSFCRDVGVTWTYTRCLDAEGNWDLSMERVRRGPPTI